MNSMTPMTGILDINQALETLAKLSEQDYKALRAVQAGALGITVETLDMLVNEKRIEIERREKQIVIIDDPKGIQLLEDTIKVLKSFMYMQEDSYLIAALWVIQTHMMDAFYATSYLLVTSPDIECGKSTLLYLLRDLTRNPERDDDWTPSTIFRTIDQGDLTLILDETDEFLFGKDAPTKQYKAMLNGGYQRGGGVRRNEYDEATGKWGLRRFDTFCPKALAFKNDGDKVWDALRSRCIDIKLNKNIGEIKLKRYDNGVMYPELVIMKKRIQDWSKDNVELVKDIELELPKKLQRRNEQIWRPMLGIARIISKGWYDKACTVAIKNIPDAEDRELSEKQKLLRDTYIVIQHKKYDGRIKFKLEDEILPDLYALPGPNWRKRNQGDPITAEWYANQVRIYYGKKRESDGRWWYRAPIEEAYNRYILMGNVDTLDIPVISENAVNVANDALDDEPVVSERFEEYVCTDGCVRNLNLINEINDRDDGSNAKIVCEYRRDDKLTYTCSDGRSRTLTAFRLWNKNKPEQQVAITGKND